MIIQICVGSSCHLKESGKLVELFRQAIAEHKLDMDVTLAGSFCAGKCNRVGVTVTIDDEVYPGITPESFPKLFQEKVLKQLEKERT